MIITVYGLIVFLPAFWIGIVLAKSKKTAEQYDMDMLGFAYLAIPSRHEVPGKILPEI